MLLIFVYVVKIIKYTYTVLRVSANPILSLEPSRLALGRREWGMALALTGKGWEWVGW